MYNVKILAISTLLLAVAASAIGQSVAPNHSAGGGKPASVQFLPVSSVKEGMRGIARTVFRGSEPEEFNVEILGVIPSAVGPGQDLIVGRLSGGPSERTSVFAGMSGSPVYIDGKLVGAISYSFPFSKEPMCGITPIEQMISIFEDKQNTAQRMGGSRAVSIGELDGSADVRTLPNLTSPAGAVLSGMGQNSALMAVAGQSFQRIATPVTFSGFSQQALDIFAPELLKAGLLPVAAAGGGSKITPLKKANEKTLVGGTSVSMQLTRGDYSMAAAGTVTLRDGDRIYAFGHPFLNLGSADLPMAESHVVTVVPSIANSFKLAVPDAMVGTMSQDRATGVFGNLGRSPKMIPVKISVRTSRGQNETVELEVARDEFLTSLLLNIAVFNSVIAFERGLGETTVALEGTVKLKGKEPLRLDRRFTGTNANQLVAASIATPVGALLRGRFEDLEIDQIELNISSTDGSNVGALERISVDQSRVPAGETVELSTFTRLRDGRVLHQRVPLTIPSDLPAGPLTITVGDGGALQSSSPVQLFVPRDLGDLVKTINRLKLADRLYVQLSRTTQGAIIGSNEMPNLPPSVLATLNNERTAGGIKPFVQTIVSETALPKSDLIVGGQQSITIEVSR
ncbi:MAG TPA: SpoIVB peptidase S55 domain-containing protein [Pyrinomonadaceae bacterium]|nr:SpoIVB peptidase S55 domain-containing protein [Pyrinomonadaceae bacterium]